jgi:radical SAM superfamily enzyme YgiQ (UPF0313 family)
MESLTLGYLAASLRRRSIEVDVIDAQLLCLSLDETVELARVKRYPLVGVSISAQRTYSVGVQTIRALRAAGNDSHIVVGGIFATFAHDRLLREVPEIDSVIRGDGDRPIVDLAEALRLGRPLEQVRGLTFRRARAPRGEDPIAVNPDAEPIRDLNELPWAARDDLPKIVHEVLAGQRSVGMLAGRGCEARCNFCSIPSFVREQGRRFRSPEDVVAEMKHLYSDWGVRHFRFYDDTLIGKGPRYTAWLEEFSERVMDEMPGVHLDAMGVRADGVSEHLFRKLHAAGLRKVFVGLDAGTRTRLKSYQKPQTLSTGERTVAILKDLGIEANYGFIMFQPTTTLEEVRGSFEFLQRIENYKIHNLVNRFNLFYGVAIDETMSAEGLVQEPEDLGSRRHYEFKDAGVRLLLELLDAAEGELGASKVIAANLELHLIELRVLAHQAPAEERPDVSRVAAELDRATRVLLEREKDAWSRLFQLALSLAEQAVEIQRGQAEVRAAARMLRGQVVPIVREIGRILDEARWPSLAQRTGRGQDLSRLCRSFIEETPAPPGAPTLSTSDWSTLRAS